MDDLLNIPQAVVQPEGAKPSKFIGQKFAHVQEFMQEMHFFGMADEDGLSCEVPFTGSTPSAAISSGELQTSMIQMFTDAPHPEAGNGLLCLMRLPYNANPEHIAEQANHLNLLESKADTGTLLLGAWCPDPTSDTTLAFCQFVPNLVSGLIFVENLLSYMASHSRFAALQLRAG